MSNTNYITDILELKDNNIKFYKNFYKKEKIKGVIHKIFEGFLSYTPSHCPKCGVVFDNNFEKHGFIISNIKIPDVSGYKAILRLHKQRYLCKHCNKAFTLTSKITNYGCFISNATKWHIAKDLTKKRSEKDIAFDKFKFVKSADGAMSFNMCNGETGKIIDIVEDRRLISLMKYFSRYSHKARSNVKLIVIDMYSPYVSLINKMFPNANIVIDKFHLVQLISRALNKTRIKAMKYDKKNYNKMKRYWKLILKNSNELDCSKWQRFTCFPNLTTEKDVVNYIISQNEELKQTYIVYQNLLNVIQSNDKKTI